MMKKGIISLCLVFTTSALCVGQADTIPEVWSCMSFNSKETPGFTDENTLYSIARLEEYYNSLSSAEQMKLLNIKLIPLTPESYRQDIENPPVFNEKERITSLPTRRKKFTIKPVESLYEQKRSLWNKKAMPGFSQKNLVKSTREPN